MHPEPSRNRPRPHPSERFAAPELRFDLDEVARYLRDEGTHATDGHRQVAVYKRGATTLILFAFEQGGVLDDHAAGGLATIHCISGRIEVQTDGGVHALGPRQLVVLDSLVRHSVRALEPSTMLLTVHLDPGNEGESHPGGPNAAD